MANRFGKRQASFKAQLVRYSETESNVHLNVLERLLYSLSND